MSLTELKDQRTADLDYSEVNTLFAYQNYLRGREGKEPVEFDGNETASRLAKLYPNVIFSEEEKTENRYSIDLKAKVRPEFEGTLLEALGLAFLTESNFKTQTVKDKWGLRAMLQTPIGRTIFCPGGIGFIEDEDTIEFFDHDLELEELKEKCGGDEEEIESNLHEYFNNHINETLDDPYFDAGAADQPLYFESGSQEELDRLVQLFVLTEPNIESEIGTEVRIYTETEEGDEAGLADNDGDSYWSERLKKLIDLALQCNLPVGWQMEYNDGAYDRRSGYSMSPESISYNIEEILELPARVRMAARRDLSEWLESFSLTPEELAELIEPAQGAPDTENEDEDGEETSPLPNSSGKGPEAEGEPGPENEAPLFPPTTLAFSPTAAGAE